jgi:hypothetical protein
MAAGGGGGAARGGPASSTAHQNGHHQQQHASSHRGGGAHAHSHSQQQSRGQQQPRSAGDFGDGVEGLRRRAAAPAVDPSVTPEQQQLVVQILKAKVRFLVGGSAGCLVDWVLGDWSRQTGCRWPQPTATNRNQPPQSS